MNTPHLLSIQVGKPRVFNGNYSGNFMDKFRVNGLLRKILCLISRRSFANHAWTSGICKEPIEGKVWLGKTNLSGDGQANLKSHGGPEKAVLGYAADFYPLWRQELARPTLPYGAFGENFTIAGLHEDTVCVGDTYSIGEAVVQVSQPRQPCWKLSRLWGIEDLEERVKSTGRTGWYFRVLVEGYVERGMPVKILACPFPQWTVARANEIMRRRHEDRHAALELASSPLLSESWRTTLMGK